MTGEAIPTPPASPAGRSWSRVVRRTAPKAAFVLAGLISALFVGIVIERRHAFPSYLLTRAKITWDTLRRSALAQNELRELIRVVPSASVARNATSGPSRVQFVGSTTLADPILFTGGYRQFNEYCPAPAVGCLAVEYAGDGEVVDVWQIGRAHV